MEKHKFIFLLSVFILLSAILFSYFNNPFLSTKHKEIPFNSGLKSVTDNQPEVYIISVMPPDGTEFNKDVDRENWYKSFLPSTHLPTGEPRMIYSYKHASSGFAARLTHKEVQDMESLEGFLSAYPDQIHNPCTTYSPEYLGLNQKEDGLWKHTKYGEGVIIGVVDYGIRPTHHSFKGDGIPPPPKSWGGKCIPPITCNNKIIGALGLKGGQEMSAEDDNGHGTHTASTAAGNFVDGASILGLAWGTASGTAPHAHLAIYKVCFDQQCVTSDIMGGIDKAIGDGVDLLSISLSNDPMEFYRNGIARSSFRATVKKRDKKEGILVTAVAGNLPRSKRSSVHHDAPWVLTVGASSTSRNLKVIVKLHNGMELVGESAYQPYSTTDELPLVYPGAITQDLDTAFCKPGALKEDMVKGKMVICKLGGKFEDVIAQGKTVQAAGGAAMVLMNPKSFQSTIVSYPHVIVACVLSYDDSSKIKDYAATNNPKAAFSFEGTNYDNPAPRVGAFSGRGPSVVNGHILKPDIIAPGVNILAASKDNDDKFEMHFGTSMAVPHIAGIAALIKSKHSDWSPAEIKSAIMTSSNVVNREGKPIWDEKSDIANFFDMGAGHLFTPEEANDPGLVYNTEMGDYFRYLCGLYNDDNKKVADATGYGVECKVYGKIQPEQLNYPSIGLSMKHDGRKVVIHRKVKNVGPETEYTADIKMRSQEEEVKVEVHPKTIKFTKFQKEADFEVHITPIKGKKDSLVEAHLTWVSKIERSTNPKKHYEVRSPISITLT